MPENKSIKEYALPNARQWLVEDSLLYGFYLYILLEKSQSFLLLQPLLSHILLLKMVHLISNQKLYLLLYGSVFKGEDHLRFFDHRFIGIWVLPIALTGIVFEILLIAPTNNTSPFN